MSNLDLNNILQSVMFFAPQFNGKTIAIESNKIISIDKNTDSKLDTLSITLCDEQSLATRIKEYGDITFDIHTLSLKETVHSQIHLLSSVVRLNPTKTEILFL